VNLTFVTGSASSGELPAGWEAVCPNPALAPRFGHDGTALVATGNGRRECFGYLRRSVRLEAGRTYRLKVVLRAEELDDLNRHLVHGVFAGAAEEGSTNFNDGIFSYRRNDARALGEARFPGPAEAMNAEVRLYFRFSAHGRVWWEHVSLEECEPIPPRLVTIACSWGYNDLAGWGRWLDRAGERGADIALLPEFFDDSEAIAILNSADRTLSGTGMDGPGATLLADKARRWRMLTCGTFYERRDDLILNSAPLFDRDGGLIGVYSKNNLYDPELDKGATPGQGLPVFTTDLGQAGILICYDYWFPEAFRLLAYKGAEIILFPNGGYYFDLLPARAADNGVWVAASSLNCPAGVWDPTGARAGEIEPRSPNWAPSSIRAFRKDDELRMILATVDLSQRRSPAWYGGPMRAAPGGRRARQTLIAPIEDELAAESRRWWEDA